MKRNPIKTARNKADAKYQEACMAGGGLCEICEIKRANCCHHCVEKSLSNRLRYELKNGVKVCAGCHNLIHSTADPAIFRKMDKVLGKKRINWLEKVRREKIKVNLAWYNDNLERLTKLCRKQTKQVSRMPF